MHTECGHIGTVGRGRIHDTAGRHNLSFRRCTNCTKNYRLFRAAAYCRWARANHDMQPGNRHLSAGWSECGCLADQCRCRDVSGEGARQEQLQALFGNSILIP